MSKVRRLLDWGSNELDQRLLQLAERIVQLESEGYERVELVAVLVGFNEHGSMFEPTFTPLRPADLLWVSEVLRMKALETIQEKE